MGAVGGAQFGGTLFGAGAAMRPSQTSRRASHSPSHATGAGQGAAAQHRRSRKKEHHQHAAGPHVRLVSDSVLLSSTKSSARWPSKSAGCGPSRYLRAGGRQGGRHAGWQADRQHAGREGRRQPSDTRWAGSEDAEAAPGAVKALRPVAGVAQLGDFAKHLDAPARAASSRWVGGQPGRQQGWAEEWAARAGSQGR